MPKRSGIIFVAMGAVLIASALLLYLYNDNESRQAGQQAESLMDDLHAVITPETAAPEKPVETEEPETTEATTAPTEPLPAEMPEVMINGYGYIGYVSIPELELELPVMSEWDYDRLQIAPCRHFGSSRTDDLVIAAHNFKTHFGSLKELEKGAEVQFTDMDGIRSRYTLTRGPETLSPEAVEAVQYSGHDLVLYTCTPGGAYRVVTFFDRSEQ